MTEPTVSKQWRTDGDRSCSCISEWRECFEYRRITILSIYRVRGDAKIHFRRGICSGPNWGSSRRSPDPLVGWRGDTYPPHSHPTRHRPAFGARHASPRILAYGLISLYSTNQMVHARGPTVYYFLSCKCDPQVSNRHGNDEFYT